MSVNRLNYDLNKYYTRYIWTLNKVITRLSSQQIFFSKLVFLRVQEVLTKRTSERCNHLPYWFRQNRLSRLLHKFPIPPSAKYAGSSSISQLIEIRPLRILIVNFFPFTVMWRLVKKRCRDFKNGRTNMRHDERSWTPSIVARKFVWKVEKPIRDDRRLTVDESHEISSQVGRTVLYGTITVRLRRKTFFQQWVDETRRAWIVSGRDE